MARSVLVNTCSCGSSQDPAPHPSPPFVGPNTISTDRTGGGTTTSISSADSIPVEAARTNADPTRTALTSADSLTVATAVSLEAHEKATSATAFPLASAAPADACTEPPTIILKAAGTIEMEATR